jgi:hypothetical protein
MAFERSDSAGSLSAHLAILPEHFRLATVSVRMRPGSAAFRPAQSENGRASRKVSLQGGLVERISRHHPLYFAKPPEEQSGSANPRQVSPNWVVVSAQYPRAETRLRPESR